MKNAAMRFDGLSLHHNPHLLKIGSEGNVGELISPCCEPDSESYGRKPRRISGEGELYGADCMQQYLMLERLCLAQKRSKLLLPRHEPIYAYLKELSLAAEPVENVLTYRFVFVEAQPPRSGRQEARYYLAQEAGESLWEIGCRFDIPIERLVALNPQIAYIDRLRENERVRLC